MNTEKRFLQKMMRQKTVFAALLFIIFVCFIAIFAYLISPDSTPNANRMIPEIANKKPGFSMLFVVTQKENAPAKTSFFNRLLNGQEDNCTYIPITHQEIIGQNAFVEKFIDDGQSEKIVIPLQRLAQPHFVHKTLYLGTDKFGRDILSRLIVGTRVSLGVGIIAVAVSLSIGIVLGAFAGYFQGKTDQIITWWINIIWSIPTLLLVFAITMALGKGFWQIFIAVGLTLWVSVARLVRGQVLAIKKQEYVEAAKILGFSSWRIIFKHILPNIIGPIMVIAAANFASAIVIEAGLSFLGIGVQPPQPSWGLMIKENYNFIITHNPMLALTPGIAIMLLVLAFNLLGNGLRDAFDNKQQ